MNTRANTEKAALKWLARLNSPQLSETEETHFFEWLNASPENQCAYIQAEKTWVDGSIVTSKTSTAVNPWIGISNNWGIAAAAIIILTIATIFSLPTRNYEQSFQTVVGEQQSQTLPDGTTLLLNTDTSLKINYEDERRVAHLSRGEVFFNVVKDNQRPFDVVTPSGTIRVVGTQFSVRNQENDSLVIVVEGKVKVSHETLTANQQLSIKQASGGHSATMVNASEKLAWRQKELIYRGERLETVISDLNRYYTEDISLGDSKLKSKQVIAVIHLSDVATTTQVLATSLGIQTTLDNSSGNVTFTQKTP